MGVGGPGHRRLRPAPVPTRITHSGGSRSSAFANLLGMAPRVRAAHAPAGLSSASELDAALDGGLLTVAYQPVISLTTGAVVAAESLVRLRDPATGTLRAPDSFIPLAEATGRIARIDQMVLAEAVPLTLGWRALLGGRRFSIGVNVSVASLSDPDLVRRVAATCNSAGLPLSALVIEITETVLSTPDCDHADVLGALHDLGVNVTMDDFGTGYSSLSHLSRFPVDGIKVDRRFVTDIGTGGRSGLIPAALVRLGRDLGLHVVAEGVETTAQLAALRAAGCPFAQGYLISRPLAANALTAFLHRSPRVPMPRAELPS
ncbi:MAG: hypothetical protein NVSMB55_10760 [Mycobacteriales bacterium]